jgi:basic membrane lipoprotein Med (substrate-binding protein (PBP1-ABC) superfamily)/DNA-binding SARP family transcriptional activator
VEISSSSAAEMPEAERRPLAYHSTVRFEVLGPTRVVATAGAGAAAGRPDAPLVLGGPKQRLVLALLLAHPNTVVSLDRLVDGLWGDDPPDSARHTVQSYVSELRKLLGPVIERVGAGYRVQVDRRTLDVLEFEALIADGRAAAAVDPVSGADALEAALALWRGRPFDDLAPHDTLHAESARLEELRLVAIEGFMDARLGAGRQADVVVELDRLTREHPYREELRALHMIALYRSGRQADALRAYRTTSDVLGEELGILPSPRLRRLEEQILLQDPDLDAPLASGSPGGTDRWVENPYLGLRSFREVDHARFFGQEQLVDRLVARVAGASGFTALVGPSGSGKSSAVQAGLIPRLRRDHPDVVIALMQPGVRPLAALATALAEVSPAADESVSHRDIAATLGQPGGLAISAQELLRGDRRRLLLVVVDQFEELFTMVDEIEARTFLDVITTGVRTGRDAVRVVVTLRADFYDRPLAQPTFGQLFADNVVSVVALGPEQLESAATLPARQLDIEVEPRLVGRLIADVAGQPNALPLFQYALTELFDARSSGTLDLATYERIGGVRKAVARRAESLYAQLNATEQEAARQLFLRIATVSDDIVGRRRVPASELVSLDLDLAALGNVIDAFSRYRLLALDRDPTSGSPTVEVAHEALLSEWHRLRGWIDQHRDDLAKQATFIAAVDEWETADRDPGYLLQGKRLDAYETWASNTQLRMTATEHDFLTAGVAARDADVAEHERREQHRLRLQRRSRRQLVVMFVAVAVIAGAVAYPIINRPGDPGRIVAALDTRRNASARDELVARGVEQAGDDFGFEVDVVEPPYTDVEYEMREAVAGAKLVFGKLAMVPVLLGLAGEFPDTTFVLVDWRDVPMPNVVGLTFASEQGSFLVGAAAALESTTGKVGYIGANDAPLTETFRAGFEQGVAAADPEVEVVSSVLFESMVELGHDDAVLAYETAVDLFDQGVDVIFVAAGRSGTGVIQAAADLSTADRKLWAIGVDNDQHFDISADQQEHLLTSMYKRFDAGIRSAAEAIEAGTLAEGPWPVGVADDAVGYTNSGGHLDPSTVTRLEELRAGLADGSVVVDPTPDVPAIHDPEGQLVRVDVATGSTTPLGVQPTRVDEFAMSPDGTRVATRLCCDGRVRVAEFDDFADTGGAGADAIPARDGWDHFGPAWSPDGDRLVVQEGRPGDFYQTGHLVVHDLRTGATTAIADYDDRFSELWWLAPEFSADGQRVLFHLARDPGGSTPFDVWAVPITGGEPELVARDAAFPVPLGDGRVAVVSGVRSLFGEGEGESSISIVDDAGGVRELITAAGPVWGLRASPDGTRLAYFESDPSGDGSIVSVVDISGGDSTFMTHADEMDWLDDDTLVVSIADE